MLILRAQGEGGSDPPEHGDAKLTGVIETQTQNASESVYYCPVITEARAYEVEN